VKDALISLTRSNPLRRRCASAYGVGEGLDQAIETCRRLAEQDLACTIGYGATPGQNARTVADAHLAAFERLHAEGLDGHVSVKLSALHFDAALLAELDAASAGSGRPLHIDALSPETVDATWRLVESAPRAARLGITLPGRWERSAGDTALARRLGLRVRIVKGQWAANGATGAVDPTASHGFLQVADRLSGHTDVVGVATHDVELLAASLDRLTASGTPSAAELFFGLPFSAQLRTARRYGVPVRVYVAYGDWGSPYGLSYLAKRPAAAWWLLQDLLLGKEKTWRSIRRSHRHA
jgi:proline dehydrogenase